MTEDPPRLAMIVGAGRSGSTLLTMLLNAHPDVVTVGEMIGPPRSRWRDAREYPCSCGEPLQDCPMWTALAERLADRGHVFGPNSWGLSFDVGGGRLARQLLTRSLFDGRLDRLRDRITDQIPPIRRSMRTTAERIRLFVEESLAMTGTSVFVDGSKDPVRVRHLRRHAPELDLRVIHLIRDAPAYASSRRKNRDVPLASGAKEWLRSAGHVERLAAELPATRVMRIRYEDLCSNPPEVLDGLLAFLGLDGTGQALVSDLGTAAHHIIGNKMRLSGPDEVRLDDSWRTRLTAEETAMIEAVTARQRELFGYA